MYNVYLVEDQPILRETTSRSSIWLENEFRLCGVAANGRDAWEQIRMMAVDIVITDIRMPFLDGLELTRMIRRHFPRIRIIILSGYNEFEYARQALSEGVVEYLLKPIRTSDLLAPLRKAAVEIDAERKNVSYLSQMQQKVDAAESFSRLQLLVDLSFGSKSPDNLKERAEQLGIPVAHSLVVAVVVKSKTSGSEYGMSDPLLVAEMESVMTDAICAQEDLYVFNRNGWDVRMLFLDDREADDTGALRKRVSRTVDDMRTVLGERFPAIQLMVCISSVHYGIDGVARSFGSADTFLALKHLFNERTIIDLNQPLSCQMEKDWLNADSRSANRFQEILSDIKDVSDASEIPTAVDCLIGAVEQNVSTREQRLYVYMNLARNMMSMYSLGADPAIDDGANDSSIALIQSIDDPENLRAALLDIARRIFDGRRDESRRGSGELVDKVKRYVDEHYVDPELSLSSAASYVSISISHMCSLFSKECGVTFSKYLMKKRIDRAMYLLRGTNKFISEIAFDVGYEDSNYFSKVFKRTTGMTPKEYRSANHG